MSFPIYDYANKVASTLGWEVTTPPFAIIAASLVNKAGTMGAYVDSSGALVNSSGSAYSTSNSITHVTITDPGVSGATLTLAASSSLITVGGYAATLTFTGATGVTFPTTGTLSTLAGTETLSNKIVIGSTQSLSGAGAVNVTTATTKFTSTGGAQALTLADGANGQFKNIIHEVDGGSGVLTPTTKTGFSTITFTAVGDSAMLQFVTTRGWMIVALNGAVAA